MRPVTVFLTALLLIASSLCPPAARAQPLVTEIFLGHSHPQTNAFDPVGVMSAYFKENVEKRSNGAVVVHIFPDSRLGGNRELSKLVEKNIIQTAFVSLAGLVPKLPILGITQIPFVLENRAMAVSVLDGPFGQSLIDIVQARSGYAILGFGDPGGMHIITNSQRPIQTPADLHGLKIRAVPGVPAMDSMIQSLGGKPTRVSSREEYNALASGLMDGQMNPASNLMGRRLDEVQKFATLTNHLYSPYVWIFNKQTMDSLPPDMQEMIRTTAKQAIVRGREEAEAWEKSEWGMNLVRQRLKVTELTAAQRQAFANASQPAVLKMLDEKLPPEDRPQIQQFLDAAKTAKAVKH